MNAYQSSEWEQNQIILAYLFELRPFASLFSSGCPFHGSWAFGYRFAWCIALGSKWLCERQWSWWRRLTWNIVALSWKEIRMDSWRISAATEVKWLQRQGCMGPWCSSANTSRAYDDGSKLLEAPQSQLSNQYLRIQARWNQQHSHHHSYLVMRSTFHFPHWLELSL